MSGFLDPMTDDIRALYDTLLDTLGRLGPFEVTADRSQILLRKTAAFLGIRPTKTRLVLTFYLDHRDEDPPVSNIYNASRNRVIHECSLLPGDSVDGRMMFLLAQAYDLID